MWGRTWRGNRPQLGDFLKNKVSICHGHRQLGFPTYWVASNWAVDNYPHSLTGHTVELHFSSSFGGFPGVASGKEPICQCGRHKTWVQSLGQEDSLEEGMETHSSILAWRIPWSEETGGLQSTRLEKVGHDQTDLAHIHPLWSQV